MEMSVSETLPTQFNASRGRESMPTDTALVVNEQTALVRVSPERDPATVYLSSLTRGSRETMRKRLAQVARLAKRTFEEMDWTTLDVAAIEAVRSRLQDLEYKPSYVNLTLASLRGVARAGWQLGYISGDDYQRIKAVKGVRGSRLPKGRALTAGEILALCNNCAEDESPAGARDAAILALLFGAGLRRSEPISLEVSHYNRTTGAIRVIGKGNKERIVYVHGGAQAAVNQWLEMRGDPPGPMLCPVLKNGEVIIRSMTDQAIYGALRKRALASKVESFSPHDLRRTFASDLLDRGADISSVQKLMGHANVQTTAQYDRRPEEAKRKAAQLIHMPYQAR